MTYSKVKELRGLAGVIAVIVVGVLTAYGYVFNIVNLIQGTYLATSTIVAGAIGVFIPFLGALVHFFH